MKKALITLAFSTLIFAQNSADSNKTADNNKSIDSNKTVVADSNETNDSLAQKHIQEQIEREKKYKEEQKFYQGDDYNLQEHEVDKKTVDKVPVIEPEYDFDITDLYAD